MFLIIYNVHFKKQIVKKIMDVAWIGKLLMTKHTDLYQKV